MHTDHVKAIIHKNNFYYNYCKIETRENTDQN